MGSRAQFPNIYSGGTMRGVAGWDSASQQVVQAFHIQIAHNERQTAGGMSHPSGVPLYILKRPPSLLTSGIMAILLPNLNEKSGLYPKIGVLSPLLWTRCVCPSNIRMLKPNPQNDGIWKWGLWGEIGFG